MQLHSYILTLVAILIYMKYINRYRQSNYYHDYKYYLLLDLCEVS